MCAQDNSSLPLPVTQTTPNLPVPATTPLAKLCTPSVSQLHSPALRRYACHLHYKSKPLLQTLSAFCAIISTAFPGHGRSLPHNYSSSFQTASTLASQDLWVAPQFPIASKYQLKPMRGDAYHAPVLVDVLLQGR